MFLPRTFQMETFTDNTCAPDQPKKRVYNAIVPQMDFLYIYVNSHCIPYFHCECVFAWILAILHNMEALIIHIVWLKIQYFTLPHFEFLPR